MLWGLFYISLVRGNRALEREFHVIGVHVSDLSFSIKFSLRRVILHCMNYIPVVRRLAVHFGIIHVYRPGTPQTRSTSHTRSNLRLSLQCPAAAIHIYACVNDVLYD